MLRKLDCSKRFSSIDSETNVNTVDRIIRFGDILFCFRFCKGRGFATQAHPKVNSANHNDVHVTTLPNKLVVASVDANSPITRISIAFR